MPTKKDFVMNSLQATPSKQLTVWGKLTNYERVLMGSVTTLAVALVAGGIFFLATSKKVGAPEVFFALVFILSGLALSGGLVYDIRQIAKRTIQPDAQSLYYSIVSRGLGP